MVEGTIRFAPPATGRFLHLHRLFIGALPVRQQPRPACVARFPRSLVEPPMEKISLAEKFSQFNAHWSPKIIAELNGQHVKLVKFKGSFVWHSHEHEDELFHVVRGSFNMEFRDHTGVLQAGDMIVVPRGVEHRPVAKEEVEVLLFEPASTVNTGNAGGDRTVTRPDWI
jgi:mannose-6-phosphate isomerase-like protein (cupin superfamily)